MRRVKERFLDDARSWYRHASMQLGAFVTFIVVPFLLNAPDLVLMIYKELPAELKQWAPVWLSPILFGLLFIARYWRQSHADPRK